MRRINEIHPERTALVTRPRQSNETRVLKKIVHQSKTYLHATNEMLTEALWPTRCIICDTQGTLLCNHCRKTLSYIDYWRACPRCGGPQGMIQCSECNTIALAGLGVSQLPFSRCVNAVDFDDASAKIITAFKDGNERRLAGVMAELLLYAIPPTWTDPCIAPTITFIPATRAAFRRRGFDHAQLLAEQLALQTGLHLEGVFKRPKSLDQRSLTRKQRIENMENRFCLQKEEPPRKVLLIDDVYTTGSTLCSASKALASAGTKSIVCATFARVW